MTGTGNRFVYLTGTAGVPYIEVVDPNASMASFFDSIAQAAVDRATTSPTSARAASALRLASLAARSSLPRPRCCPTASTRSSHSQKWPLIR